MKQPTYGELTAMHSLKPKPANPNDQLCLPTNQVQKKLVENMNNPDIYFVQSS